LSGGREGGDESGEFSGPFGRFARAEAHAERTPGLAIGNVKTGKAGPILTLEGD